MKRVIVAAMVLLVTLVSLTGCFIHEGRDHRGGYDRDDRYDRGDRHDRDDRHDHEERHEERR